MWALVSNNPGEIITPPSAMFRARGTWVVVLLLHRAYKIFPGWKQCKTGRQTVKVPIVLLLVVTATLSAPSNAQVSQQSPQDASVMERGRYVIEIAAACGFCHTPRGADGQLLPNMKLAGGRVIADRGFRAVVPNITPDPDTGIGRWSDAEIAAAIRDGRRPDGTLIGPVMPIALYHGLSDHDLMAMVAYLRAVPPVQHAVTERSTYPFPLTPYGAPVAGVPDPPEDDPVARGAYLASPL